MTSMIRTNLAYIRLIRGKLTQRAIADATGIGQKTLSALETGVSKGIEFSTLAKLCDFLKCTPNDLIIIEKEPEALSVSAESLAKADQLIAKGLKAAMDAPQQTTEEIWAEFDAMRSKLRDSAERGSCANEQGLSCA
jgi:DNA-binding Xre family transcriptional regulator